MPRSVVLAIDDDVGVTHEYLAAWQPLVAII
jgi:hypothetical protein